jgi:spermidine synthase
MAAVFGNCLSDLRVEVKTGDVGAVIREAAGAFDAILLDVDNGPDGLTRAGNDGLYRADGLHSARRALTPGGVLAVWSAAPAPTFSRRLSRCGFDVDTHAVRAGHTQSGTRHTIWIAARTGS